MNYLERKILGLFVKTNGVLSSPFFSGRGLILMFHRVRPFERMSFFEQNRLWEITPEQLELVIKFFLKNKYTIVPADEIGTYLKKEPKKKFVSFTFDDGYYDNIKYALPLFEKYKINMTVFLTPSYLKKEKVPWEFLIEEYLLEKDKVVFIENEKKTELVCESREDKHQVFSFFYSMLKRNNNRYQLNQTIKKLFPATLYAAVLRKPIMMNAQQVSDLGKHSFVRFGNHTYHHYVLSQLSLEEQIEEIEKAEKYLTELLNMPIKGLAYPYGGYGDINTNSLRAARETKTAYALTAFPGNVFVNSYELHLPRYAIKQNTDYKELKYMMNGIRHFSYNGFDGLANYSKKTFDSQNRP